MKKETPLQTVPELWKSYVLLFNTACQIVNERLQEEMRKDEIPLTPREAWVLMAAQEKRLNQGIVAAVLNINPNVMVRLIDDLEIKGLVTRVRKRRLVEIHLTEAGEALLKKMYTGWDRRSEIVFQPATWEEIRFHEEFCRSIIEDHYSKKKKWPARRQTP